MFRVPVDTVLRRASVVGLLALATTGLAACGDDSESDARGGATTPAEQTSPSSPGTSPAATTASAAPAPEPLPKDSEIPKDDGGKASGGATYVKLSKERAAKVTDRLVTRSVILGESKTTVSAADISKQIDKAQAALAVGGQEVRARTAGEAGSSDRILKANDITVMFFNSDRAAAIAARNYQQLANTNPGYGRAELRGSRMWILAVKTKWTQDDLVRFRAVIGRVEAAIDEV